MPVARTCCLRRVPGIKVTSLPTACPVHSCCRLMTSSIGASMDSALQLIGQVVVPRTAAPASQSIRQLKRKSTGDGKSYEWYTTLGGVSKGSLPLCERARLLSALDATCGVLRLNGRESYYLDAVMFMTAGQGPCVRVRSIGTKPVEIRTIFRQEFERRRSSSVASPCEKYDALNGLLFGPAQAIWRDAFALGMECNEPGTGGVQPYPGHGADGIPSAAMPSAACQQRNGHKRQATLTDGPAGVIPGLSGRPASSSDGCGPPPFDCEPPTTDSAIRRAGPGSLSPLEALQQNMQMTRLQK